MWWPESEKARQIQGLLIQTKRKKFYEAIKTVYGPTHHAVYPVKSKDGNTVIKDLQGILSRWAEHLSELLNCLNPTYTILLEQIPQFILIPDLDAIPSFHKVTEAVKGMKYSSRFLVIDLALKIWLIGVDRPPGFDPTPDPA